MTTKSYQPFFCAAALYSRVLLFSLTLNKKMPSLPLLENFPKGLMRYFLGLLIYKLLLYFGYLLMDDLTRAVSQFIHCAPVGISGGFNQPPAPEGSSAGIPLFPLDDDDINLDQPGPAALEGEGEGLAVRDCQEEWGKIEALRKDPYLEKAVRNSYIVQEEIIIEVKKAISPGEDISNRDIREGVELYLVDTFVSEKLASSRNGQLRRILRSLRDRRLLGKRSRHFSKILEAIDSLDGPFVPRS